MSPAPKKKILVTGFGPFGSHEVNASWESVKLLPELWDHEQVDVIIQEIPVSYDFVLRYEGQLEENVVAVVNVGVSSMADKLTLECVAHNCDYVRPDVDNECPPGATCVPDADFKLLTKFDVSNLVDLVNKTSSVNVEACDSCDAGHYLCDFMYYKSLHSKNGKALFVHVPPLGCPYTAEEMAAGLKIILKGILAQITP